jgi:hypothetical protein
MKIKRSIVLGFLATLCAWVIGSTAFAEEGDLVIEGQAATGVYNSDGRILLQNNCTIASGVQVTAVATYEIILKPGTYIENGARFTARNKDNDGLANRCEIAYFGHLNYGPEDDPDNDWLQNLIECTLGTDPTVQDFDNDDDGLADWWEVKYAGMDLGLLTSRNEDYDGDGVSNYIEFKLGSNPMLNDLPGAGIHYEYDELGRIKKIFRIPAQ